MANPFKNLATDLKTWLCLPAGHESLLRAWTGIIAALYMPLVWHMAVTARLYPFPSLRFGDHLVYLPLPPVAVEQMLFLLATVASILFAFGVRNKWVNALPAFLLLYYCAVDLAIAMNPIVLTVTYLFAFLVSTPKENFARRIMQIAVTSCYAYTGLQKLFERDFVDGYSLQAIFCQVGVLKPAFFPLVQKVAESHQFWTWFSYATVIFEMLLGLLLWFRLTRKITVVVAFLFHLSIYVIFGETIMLFSAVMWTGLLAFAPSNEDWFGEEDEIWRKIKANSQAGALEPIKSFGWRAFVASAIAIFIALYPARALSWFGRDLESVNMIDRLPISFAMFLAKTKVIQCLIYYQDAHDQWHLEPPPPRIGEILADSQLFSLADNCLSAHHDAKQCRVRVSFITNNRWLDSKTLSINTVPERKSELKTSRATLNPIEILKQPAQTSLRP